MCLHENVCLEFLLPHRGGLVSSIPDVNRKRGGRRGSMVLQIGLQAALHRGAERLTRVVPGMPGLLRLCRVQWPRPSQDAGLVVLD